MRTRKKLAVLYLAAWDNIFFKDNSFDSFAFITWLMNQEIDMLDYVEEWFISVKDLNINASLLALEYIDYIKTHKKLINEPFFLS